MLPMEHAPACIIQKQNGTPLQNDRKPKNIIPRPHSYECGRYFIHISKKNKIYVEKHKIKENDR